MWRFRDKSDPIAGDGGPFWRVFLEDQGSAIELLVAFQMCQSTIQEQQKQTALEIYC